MPSPAPPAGYSGTPLAKKLGFKAGATLVLQSAPDDYRALIGAIARQMALESDVSAATDFVHIFVTRRADLERALRRYRTSLSPEATVWVSWPKKAAKVATDITEDVIRAVALPLGFVDVKVCAVTDVWSGLKLVVRKSLR